MMPKLSGSNFIRQIVLVVSIEVKTVSVIPKNGTIVYTILNSKFKVEIRCLEFKQRKGLPLQKQDGNIGKLLVYFDFNSFFLFSFCYFHSPRL